MENRMGLVPGRRPEGDAAFPPYASFERVSRDLLDGYRRLVEQQGMLPATVASAMLAATVNLYELFGMKTELPALLRAMADRLEYGAPVS